MSQAARHAEMMNATYAFGTIISVSPEVFLEIVQKQEEPLIAIAQSGILSWKHNRYLTSYKGLTFFTKSYKSIDFPTKSELIKVSYMRIPFNHSKIY